MSSPADPVEAGVARHPGRPRLYGPEDERRLIMEATLVVLRRSEGQDPTVADILGEAGLATRAFYRHFEGKEEVIRALYERDAVAFGAQLQKRVDAAADPVMALEVWVDEVLGLAYDPRRAERVSTLNSPVVARAVSGSSAQSHGADLLVEPLRALLEAGRRDGLFPDTRPERDVRVIHAITWEALSWARSGALHLSRDEAAAEILRFAKRGLGCL